MEYKETATFKISVPLFPTTYNWNNNIIHTLNKRFILLTEKSPHFLEVIFLVLKSQQKTFPFTLIDNSSSIKGLCYVFIAPILLRYLTPGQGMVWSLWPTDMYQILPMNRQRQTCKYVQINMQGSKYKVI